MQFLAYLHSDPLLRYGCAEIGMTPFSNRPVSLRFDNVLEAATSE